MKGLKSLSLRTKMSVIPSAGILLLGLVAAWLIQSTISKELTEEIRRRALVIARNIGDKAVDPLLTRDKSELLVLLGDHKEASQIEYAFVQDSDGLVKEHTFPDGFPIGLAEANTISPGESHRYQKISLEDMHVLDVVVPLLDGTLGTMRIGVSLEPMEDHVAGITTFMLLIIAFVMLFVGTVAFILGGLTTRPIKTLVEATGKIAAGDFNDRVEVRSDDEVGHLATAFNRMTEKLQGAHDHLRESEETLRKINNSAMDAILMMDQDGCISLWNDAAQRIFGWSSEEVLGKELHEILAPAKYRGAYRKGFEAFQNTGKGPAVGKILELTALRKNGTEFAVELSMNSMLMNEKWNAVGIVRDVSDRKHLETQLFQSQKMEALGTLAGGIAHDFNNILTAIIGYSEMTLEDSPDDSMKHEQMSEILKAGLRAKDLVKQILTFCRRDEPELKPIRCASIFKEALKLLRATIPSTVEIRQSLVCKSDTILADPTQIHQVLMNLCTNAAHSMREKGGVLQVDLTDVDVFNEEAARNLHLEPGSYLRLAVEDTGCGMNKRLVEKIFDPFFTTKKSGEGTGMGLSVVHGIVRNCGGAVTLDSEPGRGSTFHVYFPWLEASKTPEGDVSSSLPRSACRILCVDDERAIVDLNKRMLESLGYEVTVRTDSIEALETFRADPDRFDLIITDQTMPNMTGDMLGRELIQIRSDIPVILSTGFSGTLARKELEEIGIRCVVLKPFTKSEISRTIECVLNKESRLEV